MECKVTTKMPYIGNRYLHHTAKSLSLDPLLLHSKSSIFHFFFLKDWEGRVSIGKFYDTAENGDYLEGRSFQGILDELFIYNRALSQIEISRLSQICDFRRVVLYYTFENIKDNNLIYDQSGLVNFGHIVNTSPTVGGYCGKALNFTSESYIELHGDEFRQKPANAISISVWIHLNTNRSVFFIREPIGGFQKSLE